MSGRLAPMSFVPVGTIADARPVVPCLKFDQVENAMDGRRIEGGNTRIYERLRLVHLCARRSAIVLVAVTRL